MCLQCMVIANTGCTELMDAPDLESHSKILARAQQTQADCRFTLFESTANPLVLMAADFQNLLLSMKFVVFATCVSSLQQSEQVS